VRAQTITIEDGVTYKPEGGVRTWVNQGAKGYWSIDGAQLLEVGKESELANGGGGTQYPNDSSPSAPGQANSQAPGSAGRSCGKRSQAAPTMRLGDEILSDFGAEELDEFLRERALVK
jgi:hypothetical protein